MNRPSPPSPWPKRAGGTAAIFLFLASLLIGCGAVDIPTDQRDAPPSPAVEAVQARLGALPLSERLSGVVRAENQVSIFPEISAPVIEVLVRSGEAVERNQPLVRLDGGTYQDQLRQAEASVRLAEASADEARARVDELEAQVVRTRALAAEELISRVDLETQEARLAGAKASAAQAIARVDQATATVEERRSALDKTLIRAPVAGRVGQRNAEVGMLADTNTLLFVLGDLDFLVVEVPLTERMLAYIDEGQPVEIRAATLTEPLRAELSRISPFLQQASFSTVGEIDVDNPNGELRPGMFATVDVLYGESVRATLVPTSAIWDDPASGQTGVYIVEPPSAEAIVPTSTDVSATPWPARFQPVEILAAGRLSVGIDHVEPGSWVVTVGHNLLAERDVASARVRITTWDNVIELQSLQKEDLLRGFLDKQQRMARQYGAEPPSYEQILEELPQGVPSTNLPQTGHAGDDELLRGGGSELRPVATAGR